MTKYIGKLNTPSGFRDLLPKDAEGREFLVEAIARVYKRFGFLPLETPIAEFQDVLVSESNLDFNLFNLKSSNERLGDGEKEEVSLRFDLTVPLARVVSQYGNELPRPFKRYQVGQVFRGERPQKGRYRQFTQFDADIVGAKNILADTEMVVMITEIMKELEISAFVVRVNTRTLLNTLPSFISFPENLLREVLIVLDKAEKISIQDFEEELRRLRIGEDSIKKIREFSEIAGKPKDAISKLKEFFGDFVLAQDGIGELQVLADNLETLGLSEFVSFDMKIIRGFAYYTGIVFETNLLGAPAFGSVISGGRYDNLVERFTGQSLPAVGVSVGVDRFETALRELGYLDTKKKTVKVVVASLGATREYILSVAKTLRNKNIISDVYVGSKEDLKSIFSYAEDTQAGYVAILGSKEEEGNEVSIKNLMNKEQQTISLEKLSSFEF
jgi:histidyl-tRNA synthetase